MVDLQSPTPARHLGPPALVILLVLVAGCVGGDAPPPKPATPTPKPLPERPANLSAVEAVEFAERYEAAYGFNEQLSANTTQLTVNPVRAYLLEATATGYVVHLEVGLSTSVVHYDPERREWVEGTGDGFYTVNYFVNGTTLRRAVAGGQQRPGPDPRNGTVLDG